MSSLPAGPMRGGASTVLGLLPQWDGGLWVPLLDVMPDPTSWTPGPGHDPVAWAPTCASPGGPGLLCFLLLLQEPLSVLLLLELYPGGALRVLAQERLQARDAGACVPVPQARWPLLAQGQWIREVELTAHLRPLMGLLEVPERSEGVPLVLPLTVFQDAQDLVVVLHLGSCQRQEDIATARLQLPGSKRKREKLAAKMNVCKAFQVSKIRCRCGVTFFFFLSLFLEGIVYCLKDFE